MGGVKRDLGTEARAIQGGGKDGSSDDDSSSLSSAESSGDDGDGVVGPKLSLVNMDGPRNDNFAVIQEKRARRKADARVNAMNFHRGGGGASAAAAAGKVITPGAAAALNSSLGGSAAAAAMAAMGASQTPDFSTLGGKGGREHTCKVLPQHTGFNLRQLDQVIYNLIYIALYSNSYILLPIKL